MNSVPKKYKKIVVGGTFDRLHVGHQALLKKAMLSAEVMVVGLTSDDYVKKNKPEAANTLSYEERRAQLEQHLVNLDANFTLIAIDDMYGTTLSDTQIEAIVVSIETEAGAIKINQARQAHNLPPLKIEIVELVPDQLRDILSSTRIRSGKVNRNGGVYKLLFNDDLTLSQSQKDALRFPLGELFSDVASLPQDLGQVMVVGDITASNFIMAGRHFDYLITDGQSERHPVEEISVELGQQSASNPAGMVTAEAVESLQGMLMQEAGWLKIAGEEDLLVLPALLLMPLGSVIYYGQPSQGVVRLVVTEATKDKWYNFLVGADKIIPT